MNSKKYLSFFRITFSSGIQYRAALGGTVTQFAWGSMNLLLYKAFYATDAAKFPMSFEALSSYIWLQQAFISMLFLWFLDNEIFNLIRNGNVAYELVRPLNLYNMWFIKSVATRLAKVVLRCFPILIIAYLLPSPYGLSLPVDLFSFIYFLITLFLALMVVCAFCMLIYITTFYTLNPSGVRFITLSLTEFLTGAIIPIPFFPEGFKKIIELTPFSSMQNIPLRVYSGDLSGFEMYKGISLQIFWLVTLIVIGKLWMKKALKKTVIQGG
ncbi:MAG: ABC transporter permease [Clostridiales bacterium GWF2_36_10]|nr:MAG: ABC transporter permease [Clostridiales bacterium GWF2_36_10]HAN20638.1 ABC transporter permease [Clostridiales bacterium]